MARNIIASRNYILAGKYEIGTVLDTSGGTLKHIPIKSTSFFWQFEQEKVPATRLRYIADSL